jgi:hypothetical protein
MEGQGAGDNRKLIVHADNARPHMVKVSMDFMDANRMMRIPIHHTRLTQHLLTSFDLETPSESSVDALSIMQMICLLSFRRFWTVLTNLRQSGFLMKE